jgi:hypothetical protein
MDQSSCRNIGILATLPIPESQLETSVKMFFIYPLLAMLYRSDPARHFEYVDVHNSTSRYEPANPKAPCAVICLDCARKSDIPAKYQGSPSATFGDIAIFDTAAQSRGAETRGALTAR